MDLLMDDLPPRRPRAGRRNGGTRRRRDRRRAREIVDGVVSSGLSEVDGVDGVTETSPRRRRLRGQARGEADGESSSGLRAIVDDVVGPVDAETTAIDVL